MEQKLQPVASYQKSSKIDVHALEQKCLGLSKKSCQDMCEGKSLVFRLVSVDGEDFLGMPDPSTVGRRDVMCIEIVNLKVVKATLL